MDNRQQKEWLDSANKEKYQYGEPVWSFDCGSKLDFDGPVVRASSRFYCHGNDIYEGSVTFVIGVETIFCREFSSRYIDVLREDIEKYSRAVTDNIESLLKCNLHVFVPEIGKRVEG